MTLTNERKEALEKTYQFYLHHEAILKMKEIPAHIGSNVYIHTFKVVKKVMKKAIKSHKNLDLENLLIAAVFHDYYLYNWRTTKDRPHPHGKYHPGIAAENAKRDFNISEESQRMIKTHMWPFNFFNPPKGKEARLLCNVDTWIALVECLTTRKHKIKKADKYINYISTLF
ncbi:MAG: hypothetical protein IKP50_04585 [Bacilli bacterium]|nr:hypothetical protein [Bacilli bacterium]